MKRIVIISAAVGLIAIAMGWTLPGAAAQAPGCRRGSDQTPAEVDRRRVAVGLVRAIHNTQASFAAMNGRYGTLSELAGLPTFPTGSFETRLVANGLLFAVSVRDSSDPCGYTLFSDQQGLIFIGAPMQ